MTTLAPVDIDASDLPVGAVLWRWYRGRLFCVEIVRRPRTGAPVPHPPSTDTIMVTKAAAHRGWWRYKYDGRRWKTLSAIAREITGDPTMSGNRFFGLRHRRGRCRAKTLRRN